MGECSLLSLPRNLAAWLWIFCIISLPTISYGWYVPVPAAADAIQTRTRMRTRTACQMAVISGIESTPNPSSFLIRVAAPPTGLEDLAGSLRGKTFASGSFTRVSDHDRLPEIASILDVDGVVSVFAMATALTINKKASAKWEVVLPLVTTALIGNDNDQNDQDILLQGLLALTSAANAGSPQSASASAGQVRMRMQFSNKIPIQVEGTGYLGTVQRRKLSPKFQESMESMMQMQEGDSNSNSATSNKLDFFGGRKWVDRGIRYLPESHDDDGDGSRDSASATASSITPEEQELLELEAVLQTESDEIDAAYSTRRLAGIVANSNDGSPLTLTPLEDRNPENPSNNNNNVDVEHQNQILILDLEAVDRSCDLAEKGDEQALQVLATFVSSRQGSLPARRNALAFLGGTGDIGLTTEHMNVNSSDLVFMAIVSALQHEKSPIMRRTAGDALSDLGDPRAIPYAITAMEEDRSRLVQWRAARILGEFGDAPETLAVLKQASFSSDKYAFDIAFEIKDALRKVKARVVQAQERQQNGNGNDANIDANKAPRKGPMWKQIQEGVIKSSSSMEADDSK
uniref:Scaffold protein Nfu/NifU N-terminal domain-containing protein n=1 Tax=Chaetoceros debilis TaxID=122233 RepID=A0A7S3QEW4_9STRA